MRKIVGLNIFCMVLMFGLRSQPTLYAQLGAPPDAPVPTQPSSHPDASPGARSSTSRADVSVPVPEQIRTARTIFIANAGDKTNLFPDVYSGGPDRPYVQFYADLQNLGRYQLVSSPDQADLVFQIGLVNPIASERLAGNNAGYWNGAEWHDPQLRLDVVDPKTHISLWQLTSHIESTAGLKNSRDKQFDLAMNNLVAEIQQLSTQTMTTENSSLLRQKEHSTRIKVMTIISVAAVAVGVGSFAYIASHNHLPTLPPPTFPNPVP